MIDFDAQSGTHTYEVVGGYDTNGNNALDDAEANYIFKKTPAVDANGAPATQFLDVLDKIIIPTATAFASNKTSVINNNVWGTDYAGDLISAFGHGSNSVDEAIRLDNIQILSTAPGLSHPVGARWNSSNSATTYKFIFDNATEAGADVRNSNAVSQIIDAVIASNLVELIADGTTSTTTSSPLSFSESKNFVVTDPDPLGFDELAAAFGKVTLNGSFTVAYRNVSSTSIYVESVSIAGSFDDLYDFAYGSGGPAREASIVQAGHATLAVSPEPNSGKVFYTRVQFSNAITLNRTY